MAPLDYALACVDGADWNADLSPWPAPRVSKSGADFSGGAPEYLKTLTEEAMPAAERTLSFTPAVRGLIGYSMAGLFALFAMCRTDAFQWFASVSGSLWYDGFLDYAAARAPYISPQKLYLSLGDREARTKNARMAAVSVCTERSFACWKGRCAECVYETNPGGHFDDPDGRLARAVRRMMGGPE